MNTWKRFNMATFISLVALSACLSPAKKSEDRAEEQVSRNIIMLGNNLDSLQIDDFAFPEKLIARLDQFEDSLNAINDRLRIRNKKSDAILNSRLDSIRKQGYLLQNKLHQWAEGGETAHSDYRMEVLSTFDRLKQLVKSQMIHAE